MLDAEGYEALIVAVGSEPIVPRLPGIDKPHVHWAPDADTGKVIPGDKTVIVGAAAVGVECAIGLKRAGKDVTVVEMAPDMANLRASAGGVAMELMALVEELGDTHPSRLQARRGHRLHGGLPRHDDLASRIEFPADTVLLAVGMAARHEVADALRRSAPETEVFVVGDAARGGEHRHGGQVGLQGRGVHLGATVDRRGSGGVPRRGRLLRK